MSGHSQRTPPRSDRARLDAAGGDWPALADCPTPEAALEDLALWLGRSAVELRLECHDEGRLVAEWRSTAAGAGDYERHTATIRGEPAWRLRAFAARGSRLDRRLQHAGLALEAWRAAHTEPSPAETRLAARARELDLIQRLGRRAAEAQTPDVLFSATIAVLQQAESLDLALVASSLDTGHSLRAFVSRPFERACLVRLAARAGELLGWPPEEIAAEEPVEQHTDEYDPRLAPRSDFREGDLVLLPIVRRNRPVACLLFLPSTPTAQDRLRLLYSAANQLSVHLDRILTGREAEADRFRQILESMPQGVLLADRDLRVIQGNRAAHDLLRRLGDPAQQTLGDTLEALGLLPVIDLVRVGGARFADGELGLGDEATFGVTVSPLTGHSRNDGALVIVFNDVTESRRMQRRLAQSEKMSSLGQLISGTAHELNNPLASVLGYAQLLHATADADSPSARRVEMLCREAERCQKIVHNLLAFARQRAPERTRISLNAVVSSALALLKYQLRVESVTIESDLDPDLPALCGDPHQLQQVLINLLTNAKDAIRDSGQAGQVHVRTSRIPEGVELEVRDDGPGIPAEQQARIFDPFFTTKAEGKGTGLGLSIVYGIVTSHGGTIELSSPEAGGACFRLRLPRTSSAEAPAPPSAEPLPEEGPQAGRVLVVDDEQSVAELICDALSQDGHVTARATDGSDALGRLKRETFDVIIADVKMPGMGGDRLFEEIRRRHSELVSRLVLTTGDVVSDEPDRFARRHGLELLRKPFDLKQLRESVRRRVVAPGTD